jgi:hypothetical protein
MVVYSLLLLYLVRERIQARRDVFPSKRTNRAYFSQAQAT